MVVDESTVCEAVEAWLRDIIPSLQGSYPYGVAEKSERLPDVVVELERTQTSLGDPRFPFAQLEQVMTLILEVVCDFMIDNTDPAAAATWLREADRTVREQAIADTTLGGRVFLTSQIIDGDFIPQFVEYDDGTRGRRLQVRLTLCEIMEATQ